MTITTGSALKQFWADKTIWTEIAFVENLEIRVNGQEIDDPSNIDDSAVIEIVDGDYCCGDYDESLPKVFEDWQKNQVMTRIFLNVPTDKLEEIKAFLAHLADSGWILVDNKESPLSTRK
jgi:hypothetical protein